jgi:CHAT domain-containing protein
LRNGRCSTLAFWAFALGVASVRADPACTPSAVPVEPTTPAERALVDGNAALRRGDSEAARVAFEESERLAKGEGAARLTWIAAANAQRAVVSLDGVEGAVLDDVEARLDALTTGEGAPPTLRATLLVNLGRTWTLLGERYPVRAPRARRRAADAFARAASAAAETDDPRTRSFAWGYSAELYEQDGRFEEAHTLARRAIFEASRASAPDALYRWHWQLARIEQATGADDRALASLREAVRVLASLRAERVLGSADDAIAFRDAVEPVYLSLVDLLLRRAAAMDAEDTEARQAALSEARDALEALKVAEVRDYFGDPCLAAQPLSAPAEVEGAVVLYPVLLPDRVELLVKRRGVVRQVTSPATRSQVEAAAARLGKALRDPTTRRYRPPAEQLYQWLVQPVEQEWSGGDATLVFVPSGILFQIPLAALVDPRSGEFLVEQVPVAVTPSLLLTDPRPIDRARTELLVAGLEGSVEGYPALPAVAEEIAAVRASFPQTRVLGGGFSRAGLERELTTRPFGIVHVASHGEFSADSGESFLLAQDGRIGMDVLAELIGRTRFRTDRPLQLLTLSACSTAEGDARAALGLAGIAIQSGARSALATLWRVDDYATAQLVAEFYVQLSAPGVSRARALQSAQRKLISQRAYRHPSYWAAFLLINSWL